MHLITIFLLVLRITLTAATPAQQHRRNAPSLPLPAETIFQFNTSGTWIENIAVRSNGALLVTLLYPAPQLYLIPDPWSDSPAAELVYTFPDATGLLGITEIEPETFVLASGVFSDAGGGNYSVWEVAFRGSTTPAIRKITDIPSALLLNGVAAVPGCGSAVLISDCAQGLVYRVDTRTGDHTTAVQVPEMAPIPGAASQIGINGIKIRGGYLYFDNSYKATMYRIKLTRDGFAAAGARAELVATLDGAPFVDDFAIAPDGAIWAATNIGDTLWRINGDGNGVVAGLDTELTVAGDTAAAFGRTSRDGDMLYVVTCGALGNPVNGTITEPAKVVAIDTAGCR
ncbi:hypothetical protein BJ170DRAFT_499486 [Xylariales sp. AK1849]|nr:hypothetical protein BJ170DRAFT_499486 [Xylariales sp. AK1849]